MKKEIIAALVLVLLFAGTLFGVRTTDKLIGRLLVLVDQAETAVQNQDTAQALQLIRTAADKWQAVDKYTHIFLRHGEVDSTTDAFCQLLTLLCSEDSAGAEGAFRQLRAHLNGITEMEQVRLGSIL